MPFERGPYSQRDAACSSCAGSADVIGPRARGDSNGQLIVALRGEPRTRQAETAASQISENDAGPCHVMM